MGKAETINPGLVHAAFKEQIHFRPKISSRQPEQTPGVSKRGAIWRKWGALKGCDYIINIAT